MTLSRKRKLSNKGNNRELEYEKKPRAIKHELIMQNNVKVRNLLPIKVSSGKIIHQTYEESMVESAEEEESSSITNEAVQEDIPKSSEELLHRRKKIIEEKKLYIAKLSSAILSDPQANHQKIKRLRLLLEEKDNPECLVTIRKLVTASLGCIFVDIIPGYRIRERTEQEKEVKLSKDVKALTDFEEDLLCQYQLFLKSLEHMIKQRKFPAKSNLISVEASYSLGEIAIHTLTDLFVSTPHFNFHQNIITVIVPIANDDKDPAVRKRCCEAICLLFSADKQGQATLATVKTIARVAKECGPHRLSHDLLDTLLSLRIKTVDYSMIGVAANKQEKKNLKEAKKKLSKRERKQMKKQKSLTNELKEIAASEDINEKTKTNTEIVQQIFLIYFRILKHKDLDSRQCKIILPNVLEGLAKYAHLINIDFFGDLLKVLQQLVCSESLSIRENLHCIFTVFQILSGQGEVINIDPVEFYKMLYKIIFQVAYDGNNKQDNVHTLLSCADMMLNKRRKQVTLTSLCAFIKRLAALALQLKATRQTLDVLNQIEKLLDSNSKTISLFDVQSEALGAYDQVVDDPVHSKAHCAVMWDLHLLRRHYVPVVSKFSASLLRHGLK